MTKLVEAFRPLATVSELLTELAEIVRRRQEFPRLFDGLTSIQRSAALMRSGSWTPR